MARNSTLDTVSIMSVTGLAGLPTRARLTPKMMAKNSTCSTSLRASASNEVVGMMLRMKPLNPPPCSLDALAVYVLSASASRLAVLMFMPTPGRTT